MFISIRYKLFATLLSAVVAVVVGMFFLIYWNFDRGFLNYVNTVETKRLYRCFCSSYKIMSGVKYFLYEI